MVPILRTHRIPSWDECKFTDNQNQVSLYSRYLHVDNKSFQWRGQNIADARAQHGHTTFVQTSARHLDGLGHAPQKIFTASQVCSEATSFMYTVNSRTVSVRDSYTCMAILHRSISRPFSARFAIDNDTITIIWWGTASSC